MLINYLKILWRQLYADKTNSIIHIGGLAIGISTVLVILIYVRFEQSFDADLKNADQLYRINLTSYAEDELVEKGARTSPAMGETFAKEVASVEDFSRVVILGEVIAGHEEQFVREEKILITDQQYFDFFDTEILEGDLNKMGEPLKVMLSQTIHDKIFGEQNGIGKTLEINSTNFDGTVDFEVVGVFDSPAANRHLRPEILISYATLHHFIGKGIDQSYDWLNLYSYLKLAPEASVSDTEDAINESFLKHYGENLESSNSKWALALQPIKSIHTTLDYTGEFEKGVDGKNLNYFLWIGVFVLLMVYLNSINISNAKAMSRAREIGVRKVSGGNKFQLFSQFMFESLIVNLFATIIASALIFSGGKLLNNLLDLGLPEDVFEANMILNYLIGFWLLGTFISGVYPALILTSFSPSGALKGTLKFKLKSALARPLLVSQLVFCLVIIAGVLTVYKQLDFMREQKLGLNLEDKLVFRSPMLFIDGSGNYQEQIQNSIGNLNSVNSIAATNEIPGNEVYWRSDEFHAEGKEKNGAMFNMLNVGAGYFDVFEIEILAGKKFNLSLETGSEAIINKKALSTLGFSSPEDAIGKALVNRNSSVPITAVVDDYRQQGVKVDVEPLVLNYSSGDLKYYVVDINGSNPTQALSEIKSVFNENYKSSPFEYYFLDEHFDKQYKSEQQFVQLFGMASLVAIIIAVMGILGVTNQLVLQKNKELSIRKILGATPAQLLNLISGEYFIWLGVCFAAGIPLSYYILSGWLENFQLQISLGFWFFVLPALTIFMLFLMTTCYQTLKLVFVNPSEILKDE
ncbi:ABC transporter permease [Algoriphagus machipongonensis]|uniref:Efflux ABC transporter, permease protein n=1 Tax=Algoriphagus machipongonensis TaxID=388413 RepID=A3I1L6_9BACT|nr:ABC transporter permease [Algoriphagus machipongonensis]EAZ79682.1 efflux ABC transporter, permease protein [Algoriphagus machipongonensis]